MKKAIIICILSLSMCLCAALPTDVPKPPVQKENETIMNPVPTEKTTKTPDVVTTANLTEVSTPKPVEDTKAPNKTSTSSATEKIDDNNSKKTDTATVKPVEPVKTTEKASVETTPAPKPPTTIQTVTEKSTEAAKVTEKPILAARGFDSASFVGGIILTLGLLAIGFMGFKYYKNQTERNYHTL